MNADVVTHLRELVREHGPSVGEDPRRLRSLLSDRCPDAKKEIAVLAVAAECRVPQELASTTTVWAAVESRLRARLESERAIDAGAAAWAVRAWAAALGKLPAGMRVSAPAPPTSPHATPPLLPPSPAAQRLDRPAGPRRPFVTLARVGGCLAGLAFLAVVAAVVGLLWPPGRTPATRADAPAGAEFNRDWEEYERASMTTGTRPFIVQMAPQRMDAWKRAAEAGDARALVLYSRCLQEGASTPAQPTRARELLQKAADQGNALGQVNLGRVWEIGEGGPKDEAVARAWYQKAADQGDAVGQNNFGCMWLEGKGGPKDETKARELFQKAADQGEVFGRANLGYAWEFGKGGPQDVAKAKEWYQKAAAQGNEYAKGRLAELEKPK